MEAFREGFSSVFPISTLHGLFSPAEMDTLICGAHLQKWDIKGTYIMLSSLLACVLATCMNEWSIIGHPCACDTLHPYSNVPRADGGV